MCRVEFYFKMCKVRGYVINVQGAWSVIKECNTNSHSEKLLLIDKIDVWYVEGESKKSAQAQILAINEKSAIFAQSSWNSDKITYS